MSFIAQTFDMQNCRRWQWFCQSKSWKCWSLTHLISYPNINSVYRETMQVRLLFWWCLQKSTWVAGVLCCCNFSQDFVSHLMHLITEWCTFESAARSKPDLDYRYDLKQKILKNTASVVEHTSYNLAGTIAFFSESVFYHYLVNGTGMILFYQWLYYIIHYLNP